MDYVVPIFIFAIVVTGLIKKVPVFDAFITGAKNGLKTVYSIAPTLVGLIVSVGMLKSSGALDLLCDFISPIANYLGFPSEVAPMAILRPVSGSGSTALLNQILSQFGPDSPVGRMAAVMAGSSETTFYAITVYYGSVGIQKIRHTMTAALIADFTAAVMAVLTVNLLMS